MKKGKGAFVACVALAVAAVGVIIALAAYFKNRSSYLYDDDDFLFDDPEDLAYYNTSHGIDFDEQDAPVEGPAEPVKEKAISVEIETTPDNDEMALDN